MAKRKTIVRCGLCKHPMTSGPYTESTQHGTCHAACVSRLYATN